VRAWLIRVTVAGIGLLVGLAGVSGYNDDGPYPWYVGPGIVLTYVSIAAIAVLLAWGLFAGLAQLISRR
jgi:hypothetical protein